jgi:hypothetical protein
MRFLWYFSEKWLETEGKCPIAMRDDGFPVRYSFLFLNYFQDGITDT